VTGPVDTLEAGKLPLAKLKLNAKPILSDADIVWYDWEKHSFLLTSEARKRLPRPPLRGLPFVVVADGRRCYLGTFWTPLSSFAPNRGIPVILMFGGKHFSRAPGDAIRIRGGVARYTKDRPGSIVGNSLREEGQIKSTDPCR